MLSFFSKKPSGEDATQFIERMVARSRIFVHYKDGNYAAFMVMTDVTRKDLEKNLIYKDSIGALIKFVERRIEARKFEDSADEFDMAMYRSPRWEPNMLAKRVIVANDKPVYAWDVEINDNGSHKISIQEFDA